MKARPILMSAPMVRALLAGTKSQTRRIVKPQPKLSPHHEPVRAESRGGRAWVFMVHADRPGYAFATGDVLCPYGAAGDYLWTRETWARNANQTSNDRMDTSVLYRADGEQRALDNGTELPWHPSIHMPRAVSRLTLRITDVRVERLQDIGEADAKAEGVGQIGVETGGIRSDSSPVEVGSYAAAYAELWDEINGRGAWETNPWIFALTFTVEHRNVDDVLRDARAA